MWILGLNGPPIGWHDAAACLIDETGKVWAMSEEERLNRVKHAPHTYPALAAQFCLDQQGLAPEDIDVVAIGWDLPRDLPHFGGRWEFSSPRQFLAERLGWRFRGRACPELVCVPHHRAHALSTFYASGYDEASILVNDGNGDDESISIYEARFGGPLVRREVWPRSHSIGFMYDAASRALGLHFLEAGKTMGLASYGRARGMEPTPLMVGDGVAFRPPFDRGPEAGYREVVGEWSEVFSSFGDVPITTPSASLDTDDLAIRIAWSAQATVEQVVPALVDHARRTSGIDAVCLAGGVALNCSTNGLLRGPVYVPPVSHDAGACLGAAWHIAPPAAPLAPMSPYLGSPVGRLSSVPEAWSTTDLDLDDVVERLQRGQVGAVAWGRAEVGPRALGHRSIIALPREEAMRDHVNDLKGRERWRPLAPIGLPEANGHLWEGQASLQRYMLGAANVTDAGRKAIPATAHVDGTARAQVVDEEAGLVRDLLVALKADGADPVLINTSFNLRGEPIVDTADDALAAAEKIDVDFLALGDDLLVRR